MVWTKWPAATAALLVMSVASQPAHAAMRCSQYSLRIVSDSDANDNSAIAVDIVISYENRLSKILGKLTAAEYFGQRDALQADFAVMMKSISLQLPPGVDESVPAFRGCSVFLFANYASSGEHRLVIARSGVISLRRGDLGWAD